MNETTLSIDDKEYIINIDKAIELGIAKLKKEKIENFQAGDVFEDDGCRVMIIDAYCDCYEVENRYQIAGFYGAEVFSDFDKLLSREEMINHLNEREYVFVRNINAEIEKIINSD
jgi:hypothetical protein